MSKMKITLLFVLAFGFWGNVLATDPVYLQVVSNTRKTINYTVGIYPAKLTNNTSKNQTTLIMYLINDATTDLIWTRMNRVLIVLKNNKLVYSLNVDDDSDETTCAYIVPASKGFHEQTLLFEGVFSATDIANIYLLENSNIYQLDYYRGEK